MNTVRSVGYGWGVLILAGGGAYYFAKRSVNSDREQRAALEEQRRQQRERMRVAEQMHARQTAAASQSKASITGQANAKRQEGHEGHQDPSRQAQGDPAPVTHEQESLAVKGQYEAAEPFRSRKGDRFS
ncbi:hypothetical protein MBLNU230_g0508t1 [Neophaeotheca triangularis]